MTIGAGLPAVFHLFATPHIAAILRKMLDAKVYGFLEPILSFVFVLNAILLLPLSLITFISAAGLRRGERWAWRIAIINALHIFSMLTHNTRPMSIFEPAPPPWPSRMLAVLRIVAGLMFMTAGTMIVFGSPPSPMPMPPFSPTSQLGIGGILELFGGLAIVLGVLTRPIAFVLAGEMAVAYFQFHAPQSFFPTVNNGVAAVMYCFLFLYLTFAGPGAWSIDAIIARRAEA